MNKTDKRKNKMKFLIKLKNSIPILISLLGGIAIIRLIIWIVKPEANAERLMGVLFSVTGLIWGSYLFREENKRKRDKKS